MKKILFTLLLIKATIVHALIIESSDIHSVFHHVYDTHHHKEILVVFDIDNTIGHVKDGFGGDEWFTAMVKEQLAQGNAIHAADGEILPIYLSIQKSIWLDPVQPETQKMIRFLQDVGIAVIALTSRSLIIKERTFEQLAHMNIDFSLNTLYKTQFDLTMYNEAHLAAHYENGIIFSSQNDKGELLVHFFSAIDYHPKKVIFVDDKLKYVEQVERAMNNVNIPYIGIRYSHLDFKVKNFNIKDYQQRLNAFLSE